MIVEAPQVYTAHSLGHACMSEPTLEAQTSHELRLDVILRRRGVEAAQDEVAQMGAPVRLSQGRLPLQ
jgi:hypothetical protein